MTDKDKYIAMCRKILDNIDWYTPIPPINLEREQKALFSIIDEAYGEELIDKETMEYLKIEYQRVPILYSLPKVHKSLKDLPGRPIILGNGSLTEAVSE